MNFNCGAQRMSLPCLCSSTLAMLGLATIGYHQTASAATLKTLYSFCSQERCADGAMPLGGVVRDAAGNLFGVTEKGGGGNGGTVFELKRSTGKYKFHQLYSFCSLADCADGQTPVGKLVIDSHGSVYGAVSSGGANGKGAIFKLTPRRSGSKFSLVYSFCAQTGCADGSSPLAGLTYQGAQTGTLYDGISALYGTTSGGGINGSGSVFQLIPGKSGGSESVIYSFCSQSDCTDGRSPSAALIMDATGNLYGTTNAGGTAQDRGTAFELSPRKGSYKLVVLHSFCELADCADGDRPAYPLVMGENGDLFGTTEGGGSADHGVVFRVTPNGNHSRETVLYKFCKSGNCKDGYAPLGALSIDANGDLIGTTHLGGEDPGFGTIYRLHNTGETVLYSFCQLSNCTDGAGPYNGVVFDDAGNMYGSTITGGANITGGAVFEFTP